MSPGAAVVLFIVLVAICWLLVVLPTRRDEESFRASLTHDAQRGFDAKRRQNDALRLSTRDSIELLRGSRY